MRIAIDLRSLASKDFSGVENYCSRLVAGLLEMDRHNEYILFTSGRNKTLESELQFVNAKECKVRWPNRLLNLVFLLGFKKIEDFTGPVDLVFMPNPGLVSLRAETKLVLTVHDLSPELLPEHYDFKRRVWHKMLNLKKLANRADIIIAVSEHTKQDIVKLYGILPDKIKVIYPGVDIKKEDEELPEKKLREIRNTYNLPGRYLLFINTLEPRKNLGNLLKAFNSLHDSTHLVIAGKKGWNYNEFFKQIKNSPKKNQIHYLGYVKEEDKASLISLAKAVVYPSFYEGFGFQPVEAFALGVPVVATQVSSVPEITGDAALLVNPYHISGIAQGLTEVLNNNFLRAQLIAKGRERAGRFNWVESAKKVLTVFESVKS